MTIRASYLDAAAAAAAEITAPQVHQRWDEPSALPRMSVGELATHLARSLFLVDDLLVAPDPALTETITPAAYFGDLSGLDDLDSALNTGVRERSRQGAAAGFDALVEATHSALARLLARLDAEPADRQVTVFGGRAMLLDDYLRTRLVEFAVHLDDLGGRAPGAVLAEAIEVLVSVARHRHGDLAVLRALARRERDDVRALRVL